MSTDLPEWDLSHEIIAACIEVHRTMGPGLLESTYEECLAYELESRGIEFRRQQKVPLEYKGVPLESHYLIDLLIENRVIVELKSVEKVLGLHAAQLLTYMKLLKIEVGLLVNFNVPVLRDGVRRLRLKV